MMMNKISLFALAGVVLATSAPASAETFDGIWDTDRMQIRGRVIGVVPQEDSSTNIGGSVGVGNAVTPEIDLSYFFTENIAAEAIFGTAQHSLNHSAAGDLGRTWILPPTVTLQYHFSRDQAFSPYVGAGLNYSIFYGEEAAKGNGINDLDVGNGLGYALQAGADYWIDENWGWNFDVKKLFLNVDATLNSNAIQADIDIDPWIIGTGISYRF